MARGPFSEITKQTLSGDRRKAPVFTFLPKALVTSERCKIVKNTLMYVMVMKSQLVKSVMELGSTSLALNLINDTI